MTGDRFRALRSLRGGGRGGHDHARFFRYWRIAGAESPAIPLLPAYLRSFAGV